MRADGLPDVPPDRWSSGDAYERYVGRWSRLVARRFVRWLAAPPEAAWLDVGCGIGALAQTVLELGGSALVCGADPSASFGGHARTGCRRGLRRGRRPLASPSRRAVPALLPAPGTSRALAPGHRAPRVGHPLGPGAGVEADRRE
ncbi:MAG TPA: hypothetical protein VNO34_07580, partial [Actinomycetota bacterium]|nr:hypothetical protein [Actinomycetota bacterium]